AEPLHYGVHILGSPGGSPSQLLESFLTGRWHRHGACSHRSILAYFSPSPFHFDERVFREDMGLPFGSRCCVPPDSPRLVCVPPRAAASEPAIRESRSNEAR